MKKIRKMVIVLFACYLLFTSSVFATVSISKMENVTNKGTLSNAILKTKDKSKQSNDRINLHSSLNNILKPIDNPEPTPDPEPTPAPENSVNTITYVYISNYSIPTNTLSINRENEIEDVKWLQDMLIHCGYELCIDGSFENETNIAVKDFQKSEGLTVDGIVGSKTIEKISDTAKISYNPSMYLSSYIQPTTILAKNKTNSKDEIKWLQDMLRHCGYKLSVDGSFGTGTENAVKSFQKEKGLTSDGIVGESTVLELKLNATNANYCTENRISGEIYGTFTTESGKIFKDAIYHKTTGERYYGECLEFALASAISGYVPNKSMNNLLMDLEKILPYFRSGNDTTTGNLNLAFEKYGLEYIRLNANNKTGGMEYINPLRNWIMNSGNSAILYLECPSCSDTCTHSSGIVGKSGTTWTQKHHWITVCGYRYNEKTGKDQIMILDNSSECVNYKSNTNGQWYDIDEFANPTIGGKTYTSEIRRMYLISE